MNGLTWFRLDGLVGLGLVLAAFFQGGASVAAPRITRQTTADKAVAAPAIDLRANVYTKKPLRVSVVQGDSRQFNEGLTAGEAVLALSLDDALDFPTKDSPKIEMLALGSNRRYFPTRENPLLFETAPAAPGPWGPNAGLSRVYVTWDRELQVLRLELRQTYIDLGNGSSTPRSNPRADVFRIRIGIPDDDQRIWYHATIAVHLEASKSDLVK